MINKEACYQEVKRLVEEHADPEAAPSALCFYYSFFGSEVLARYGVRALVQAGDCQWPMIRPEDDDGSSPTHFGYVWSPHELQSLISMMNGDLPEVHIWLGLEATQEIIDFTAGCFPDQAASLQSYKWNAAHPPTYVWTSNALPTGVLYRPNRQATLFVLGLMGQKFGRDRVEATQCKEPRRETL